MPPCVAGELAVDSPRISASGRPAGFPSKASTPSVVRADAFPSCTVPRERIGKNPRTNVDVGARISQPICVDAVARQSLKMAAVDLHQADVVCPALVVTDGGRIQIAFGLRDGIEKRWRNPVLGARLFPAGGMGRSTRNDHRGQHGACDGAQGCRTGLPHAPSSPRSCEALRARSAVFVRARWNSSLEAVAEFLTIAMHALRIRSSEKFGCG